MNTCQGWRAAIITSFPCTFLSFHRGLYYNIRTAHVDSAWQRGKRRTCGGIRPTLAHANIIGVSNGRKETRAARVGTSARFVPARHTAGSLPVYRVHGAQHDAYILIAVIHRVGRPTSAALWVCPWEMAKTTCKESPRNKTTFGYPAYPLTSRRRCSMQIHGICWSVVFLSFLTFISLCFPLFSFRYIVFGYRQHRKERVYRFFRKWNFNPCDSTIFFSIYTSFFVKIFLS